VAEVRTNRKKESKKRGKRAKKIQPMGRLSAQKQGNQSRLRKKKLSQKLTAGKKPCSCWPSQEEEKETGNGKRKPPTNPLPSVGETPLFRRRSSC
jgi:hypothetical protein